MTAPRILAITTLILSVAVPAAADPTPYFYLGPAERGHFALWCILSLGYIVLTTLSIKAFRAQRHLQRRLPFALLLSALCFALFGALFHIIKWVFAGLFIFSDAYGVDALFTAFSASFTAWALPLQFLATVTLIRERSAAISSFANVDKTSRIFSNGTTFALTQGTIASLHFAVGSAAVGVYTYLVHLYDMDWAFNRGGGIPRFTDINQQMQYAYAAVTVLAVMDIVALSFLVRKRLKEFHVYDKITNAMIGTVETLYALLAIVTIVFTAQLSPTGSRSFSIGTRQGVELTYTVLYQALVFGVYTLLVTIGLWPAERWEIRAQDDRGK